MSKKKYCPPSATRVTLLLLAMGILIWSVCMYLLTEVTVEYKIEQYKSSYSDRASRLNKQCCSFADTDWETFERDCKEYGFMDVVSAILGAYINLPDTPEVYTATAVFDAHGNCMEKSWDDFFFFYYQTEEQWNGEEEAFTKFARAYFDREKLTGEGKKLREERTKLLYSPWAMRFTGILDGKELVPTKIDYISYGEYLKATTEKGLESYPYAKAMRIYDLSWTTIYEDLAVDTEGKEVVSLYTRGSDACYSDVAPSFIYDGKEYENVSRLVEELGPSLSWESRDLTKYEDGKLLIVSADYCTTYDGAMNFSEQYSISGSNGKLQFYTVSAVYCTPRHAAFEELRKTYVYTFLLMVVLVILVRDIITRHLIRPMEKVCEALSSGKGYVDCLGRKWNWPEGKALEESFFENVDRTEAQKREIIRLNMALDYAKDAEANRRQMVSNITHELKTPLAVIHSYAEGLKENIAEEKREKYLDVILAETERMDGMVLEMLDLSRLEAGRVKLARDEFSLTALAHSVFDKLGMAIKAKNLEIEYLFPEECMVVADEARIGQVIENFATNAVKYCPVNGKIRIRILKAKTATFSIENEGEPLSKEALSRVWDTFYRVDESRSSTGTGLGLAIAKNIIELHGGKCSVWNSKTGIVFSFTI